MVSDRYLCNIAANEFQTPPDRFPEDSEMRTLSVTWYDIQLVKDVSQAILSLSKQSVDQNLDSIEEYCMFTSAFSRTYYRNHPSQDAEERLSMMLSGGINNIEIEVPIAAIIRYVEALGHLLEVQKNEAYHDLLLHIKTNWLEPDEWEEHWLAKD
jgi:hypothetical protein